MKRISLLLAAVASLAATMPLASPAYARDGDQGRRAERQEARGRGEQAARGGDENRGRGRGRGRQERGDDRPAPRWQAQDRRQDDGERRRDDERPRYDDRARPNYMDGPRPNYMRPAPGVAARRGFAPDSYRGGVVDDYRRYRLRPPPQGYDWVRMGNGFALVERGSGRIFDRVD